jgi:DNA-binding PadR family transcriptional regulator
METDTKKAILSFLAQNKPTSKWQLARALKKSYGNVHATIQELLQDKHKPIKVDEVRKSNKNPKIEVEYYRLTLEGLAEALALDTQLWKTIDHLVETHQDKLLIFKKWEFFRKKNLTKQIIDNLKLALVGILRERIDLKFGGLRFGFRDRLEFSEEELQKTIDSAVLGCHGLRYFKNEKDLSSFLETLKVCKEDKELNDFVLSELDSFKRIEEDRLESVKNGSRFFESLILEA